MKTYYISIITFIIPFLISQNVNAQGQANAQGLHKANRIIDTTITVRGVCKMCEERIESTCLKFSGVKLATWNIDNDQLRLIYKPRKVTLEEIHDALIEKGHSTSLGESPDKYYNQLPDCCAYRDGIDKH